MRSGWQTKLLGEVLERTETANPCENPNAEFNYIDVSSVSNSSFTIEATQRLKGKDAPSRARKLVRTNDVIFATIRPTLQRIAIVPANLDKQICSTGYFVLRPKQSVDYKFVFYYLLTQDFTEQMESLQKGASYPAVTDGDVRGQTISSPPLPEQHRIVAILDEAFEGIATAKANAEKNLHNARALFEGHLQSVFSQSGEGWVDKSLNEICTKITDGEHLRPTVLPTGIPFLSAKDVLDHDVVFSDSLFVSEEDATKFRRRCNPEKGDILIVSRGATVGRTCVIKSSKIFCLLGSVILLKIDESYLAEFISYALKSPSLKAQLVGASEAAAQQAIYLRDIKPVQISCPPIALQESIVSILDSLLAETQRLASIYERKLASLDELKKSLLHQAFSGQL